MKATEVKVDVERSDISIPWRGRLKKVSENDLQDVLVRMSERIETLCKRVQCLEAEIERLTHAK